MKFELNEDFYIVKFTMKFRLYEPRILPIGADVETTVDSLLESLHCRT